MFYRHWKKVALALTAFFWVGCDDSTSVAPVTVANNPDPEQSSSSIENTLTPSSSSETGNTGEASQTSSSSAASSSAEQVQSSSDSFEGMHAIALYGVRIDMDVSSSSTEPARTPCYPDNLTTETNDATNVNSSIRQTTLRCEDGVICVESEREISGSLPCDTEETEEGLLTICPDYGIVSISEKTYMCDGKVYNEAEFLTRYSKKTRKISCEVFGTEVECADGDSFIIEEKDGKKTYKSLFADLTEEEFNDKYEITEPLPAPLYGVFVKKDL